MYSKRPWIVGRRARAFGNVLEHGHTVATVERCWRGTCNPDGVRDATAGRPVPRLGKSYVTRCESSLLRGREFTAEGWEDCCQTSGWRRHGRAWRLHIARETRGRFVRPRGQIIGVAGWVGLPAGSGHAVAGAQSAKVASKPAQSTGRQAVGFEEAGFPVIPRRAPSGQAPGTLRQAHKLKRGSSGLVSMSEIRRGIAQIAPPVRAGLSFVINWACLRGVESKAAKLPTQHRASDLVAQRPVIEKAPPKRG